MKINKKIRPFLEFFESILFVLVPFFLACLLAIDHLRHLNKNFVILNFKMLSNAHQNRGENQQNQRLHDSMPDAAIGESIRCGELATIEEWMILFINIISFLFLFFKIQKQKLI